MKNKLIDLNNHLFEELERLNDDELDDEKLDKEIKRAKAMEGIAKNIIDNANLSFRVMEHIDEYGSKKELEVPKMLEINNKKESESDLEI